MRTLSLTIAVFFALFAPAIAEEGKAAWYSDKLHGGPTASGEVYDKTKLTAAHPSLPFGTKVEVTIVETGKSVVVRINDRCKVYKGRIIDLSGAAARKIGLDQIGVAKVTVEIVNPPKPE